jgi:hypothetical protein
MMQLLSKIALALVALYLCFLAAAYWMMRQPPVQFASVMGKFPPQIFLVLPFETLWMGARAGTLQVGDEAANFKLPALDHSSELELASLRGKKPVVLIFGSYT